MDPTVQINERVEVIVVFRKHADFGSFALPVRLKWRGREIELSELALRFPTVQGKRMIHVFHMSDGSNDYRLEFDAEALTWMLVAMLAGDGGES